MDARVEPLGQRVVGRHIVGDVAEVVERHLDVAVGVGVVDGAGFVGVINHQHPACQGFFGAGAQGGERGLGDPRDDVLGQHRARQGAGFVECGGGQVVDADDRQAVALSDFVETVEQPAAVGLGHGHIARLAGIPAAMHGLGRHGEHIRMHRRQQFEAAIEDQPDAGIALDQGVDELFQPALGGGRVDVVEQAVGVERVEKEAAVAALPQRPDDALGHELGPDRLADVDDDAAPVGIGAAFECGGYVCQVGALRMDFAHAHIGEQFGVRAERAGGVAVVGFDHHDVVRAQAVGGQGAAVVKSDRERRGLQFTQPDETGEEGNQEDEGAGHLLACRQCDRQVYGAAWFMCMTDCTAGPQSAKQM